MTQSLATRVWALVFLLIPHLLDAANERGLAARTRAGDDARWAAPEWDDRDWQPGSIIPVRSGIHWVRVRVRLWPDRPPDLPDNFAIELPRSAVPIPPNAIFLAAPYSYELFWDGQRVGRSGVVGATREGERTGPLDNVVVLPRELLGPGEHLVAIRISSFHYNFPATSIRVVFGLVDYATFYASESRRAIFPLLGVGGAWLAALISGVLFWLVDRWRPLLWCALLSLSLAVFYFLIAWRWIHNDSYEWFHPRLLSITWVMTVIAVLFPWLLLEQFSVPARRWWLSGLLPLLAAAWTTSQVYEEKALWLCRTMLAMSLAISAWAAWRRRPGARFVLAGVLLGLVTVRTARRGFLDPSFFVTFDLLVLCVFASLGLQLRAARRRVHEATLTTARLQAELLKKNIQPHFLLNTLATIMEVIEREPRTAVTLIEALAGEFRILARVSGEKLIPLAQELELCRAHLRIMSLRKGATCSLVVAPGVDDMVPVPPALFHTLIENGLTHLLPRDGQLAFELRVNEIPGGRQFRLLACGKRQAAMEAVTSREGTGLRYIRARLEESFTGRWTMTGGPVAEGWETVIEIVAAPVVAEAAALPL